MKLKKKKEKRKRYGSARQECAMISIPVTWLVSQIYRGMWKQMARDKKSRGSREKDRERERERRKVERRR